MIVTIVDPATKRVRLEFEPGDDTVEAIVKTLTAFGVKIREELDPDVYGSDLVELAGKAQCIKGVWHLLEFEAWPAAKE